MRSPIGVLFLGLLLGTSAEAKSDSAIAFVQRDDIWLIREDATNLRRLTSSPGRDMWPAWSDDNSQLVFVSDRGGHADLWIMRADGSGARQITSGDTPPVSHPSWRGDRIVFQGGDSGIWMIQSDGSDLRKFVLFDQLPQMLAVQPVWSPLGEILAVNYLLPDYQIEQFVSGVLRYDFSHVIVRESWPYEIWNLDVDLQGEQYSYCFDSGGDIWVKRLPGERVSITQGPEMDEDPTWSPDGEKIAFVRNGWISIADPVSNELRTLVEGAQPAWSLGDVRTSVRGSGWGEVKNGLDSAN